MSEYVKISCGNWSARIELRGAQLRSLCLDGAELLWPGDPDGWKDTAPLLFPVVGRLWPDALRHEGLVRPHPMHGIVRAASFDVLEVAADRVALRLASEASEVFPWAFVLEVVFVMAESGLRMDVQVRNPSTERDLPFQFGWHPGFAGRDFRIQWDRPQDLVLHEVVPGEGWRTGRRLGMGDCVTGIAWSQQPTAWVTSLDAGALRLEGSRVPICLSAEPRPEAWVFWQRPGQDFLCLEPWYGLPDRTEETCDFASREATRTIVPQASWQVTFHLGKGD